MKKVIAILCLVGLVIAVIKSEPPEQLVTESIDPNMPRQRGFVGMEIGDVEYLEFEQKYK